MRVICIDALVKQETKNPELLGSLKEGKRYSVKQSPYYKEAYLVKGLGQASYLKSRFARLSEIDERQFKYAEPIESTFTLKEV